VFPLHKVPLGLLELLRARTLGRAPDIFSNTVTPIVDATDFYAGDLLRSSTSAPTVGALANLTEDFLLTGPISLRALSGTVVVGAAGGTNLCISIGVSLQLTFVTLAQFNWPVVAAAQICRVGIPIPGRYVIPPGASLFAQASGTVAGVDHSLSVAGLIENITST